MQQRTFDMFPQTKFPFRRKQCERDCFTQDVVVKLPLGRVCCPVAASAQVQGTTGQMWMGAPGRCMGSVTVDKCPLLRYFPSANTIGLIANWPLTCPSKTLA